MGEENKRDWIHCSIIIEVLGTPKEYIEEVMTKVVETLKKEEGIEALNENIAKVKPHENLFSTFAEIEMKVRDLNNLQIIMFKYLPSSVEIISPSELKFSLNDANTFLNALSGKLHDYDALAKRLKMENTYFVQRLLEMQKKLPKEQFEGIMKGNEEPEDAQKQEVLGSEASGHAKNSKEFLSISGKPSSKEEKLKADEKKPSKKAKKK